MTLQPGEKYSERILLNYEHEIVAPGNYFVEAVRRLPHGPGGTPLQLLSALVLELHQSLDFTVEPKEFGSNQLKVWVEQLKSTDIERRSEAARTLASLAPHSLEDTLLGFAGDDRFNYWAPLAMHRLNTPRSIAALAEILRTTQPGTSENIQSAQFLASSGDPQWFPLLLALAQKNPADGGRLYPAAISGGDRAIGPLMEMIHSETELTRQVAISALGYTGSRVVVPFLLDLLKSSEPNTSERALYGTTSVNSSDPDRGERFSAIAIPDVAEVVVAPRRRRSHLQNNGLR